MMPAMPALHPSLDVAVVMRRERGQPLAIVAVETQGFDLLE